MDRTLYPPRDWRDFRPITYTTPPPGKSLDMAVLESEIIPQFPNSTFPEDKSQRISGPDTRGRILYSGNRTSYTLEFRDILWDPGQPLGCGTWETVHDIIWDQDHLYSGIRDNLWNTGHGKWYTLSSGIRTTYPLGFVLWKSAIWELVSNRNYNQIKWIGVEP